MGWGGAEWSKVGANEVLRTCGAIAGWESRGVGRTQGVEFLWSVSKLFFFPLKIASILGPVFLKVIWLFKAREQRQLLFGAPYALRFSLLRTLSLLPWVHPPASLPKSTGRFDLEEPPACSESRAGAWSLAMGQHGPSSNPSSSLETQADH